MNKVSVFTQQIIREVHLPAKAYLGYATALLFKGREIVVMAASVEEVIGIVRDMRPSLDLDPTAIFPVALMHDRHVTKPPVVEDDEL